MIKKTQLGVKFNINMKQIALNYFNGEIAIQCGKIDIWCFYKGFL